MPLVDISGTAVGAGVLDGTVICTRRVGGTTTGAGTLSTDLIQTLLFGGRARGIGVLRDELAISVAGTATGSGSLTGLARRMVAARPLPLTGAGRLFDRMPLPMRGQGTLRAYLDLVKVPRPFCHPLVPEGFYLGRTLTRDDLTLTVTDPVVPEIVFYSMFFVHPSGSRMRVGPANRRPATSGPGFYYATGTVGEFGQPGDWVIVWRVQRSWQSEPVLVEQAFRVLADSGTACSNAGWLR